MSQRRKDRERNERQAALSEQHRATKAARAQEMAGIRAAADEARRSGKRVCRRWNAPEDKLLRLSWGETPLRSLCKQLGRTPQAVRARACFLDLGPASVRSGLRTEYQVGEDTGYGWWLVRKAVAALGLEPRSVPCVQPGRRAWLGFDEDDVTQIVAHLAERPLGHVFPTKPGDFRTKQGEWGTGRKPAACLGCERTDRPHEAKGRCKTCNRRDRRARARKVGVAQRKIRRAA